MKVSIVMVASLAFGHFAQADDFFKDLSSTPSSYVTQSICAKIESRYAKKYTHEYFQRIFDKAEDELPTTDQIFLELRSPNGVDLPYNVELDVLKLARCQKRIDDVIYNLVQTKLFQDEDQHAEVSRYLPGPSMQVNAYVIKKAAIRKISHRNEAKSQQNPFPLGKYPVMAFDNKDVTVLERLYALYSPAQIKRMAQAMDLTLTVMDAVKVETKIIFREDVQRENYVVEHTPSDIYRLALRIFNMEKKKLVHDYNSQGLPFSNLDMLAAAYEMGVISGNAIAILTTDESFYKKEKTFLSKMGSYLSKLGITAAQINPTTAPYAIIGLILYNSYQEIHQGQDRVEFENFYFN